MATHQPTDAGVAIAADGFMTFTGEPRHKTNGATAGAAGVETPFPVLGGTIADQITRTTIDTRNATNVGAATGPDAVAALVYEP